MKLIRAVLKKTVRFYQFGPNGCKSSFYDHWVFKKHSKGSVSLEDFQCSAEPVLSSVYLHGETAHRNELVLPSVKFKIILKTGFRLSGMILVGLCILLCPTKANADE